MRTLSLLLLVACAAGGDDDDPGGGESDVPLLGGDDLGPRSDEAGGDSGGDPPTTDTGWVEPDGLYGLILEPEDGAVVGCAGMELHGRAGPAERAPIASWIVNGRVLFTDFPDEDGILTVVNYAGLAAGRTYEVELWVLPGDSVGEDVSVYSTVTAESDCG